MKRLLWMLTMLAVFSTSANNRNIKLALEFYSSQRAWRVGDLLTVQVSESTAATKSEQISTEKDAGARTGSSTTTIGDNEYNRGRSDSAILNQVNRALSKAFSGVPSYNLNAQSDFSGKGSSSSNETFTSTFTARVTDVLENGVLVIRGERMIIMKNEKVNMVLSGLVRTRDISSSNTVESNRLADAHIVYENGGDVSKGAQPGFFWRLFQFFNPF